MGNISEAFGYWLEISKSYAFLKIKFLIKMQTTHNTLGTSEVSSTFIHRIT
jgi:hypothetical protein